MRWVRAAAGSEPTAQSSRRSVESRLRLPLWGQALLHLAGAVVVVAYLNHFVGDGPWNNDAWGFWNAWVGGLYDIPWLDRWAYVYSPAFAQAIWPLSLLEWPSFWIIWLLLQFAALLLIAGPFWSGVILLLPWPSLVGYPNAAAATIDNGNPQVLLALAIVAGLRWPAAWAVLFLTKVTPGVGVLWFALRGEWRRLGIALAATAVIVVVSFVIEPGLWSEWARLLRAAASANTLEKEPILPLPLVVRGPLAVAVLVWGARTNRYWTVPIACTLALPAIQLGGFAILVAALPFLGLPLTPHWPIRSAEPDTQITYRPALGR
jgi:Glycosyltransferase family 87